MNPKPWEFQPGIDTGETFAVFSAYLQLPPRRRLSTLFGSFGVAPATLQGWARDGYWKERALAWDVALHEERLALARGMVQEDAKELRERELDLIRAQKALVERELDKLLQRSLESESSQMRPADVVRMYTEAFKAERLVRGQATEIVEGELDLTKLTDQELELLDQLTQKARKEGT